VAAGVSPYTYNAIQITPNVGNNPLAVTLSFDLPSSCTGYDIDWGDGYTHTTQGDGGTSCGQNSVIINAPHTYSGSGAYTIIEKRGANLSRVDTVGITISN
jgi:hypothetical protein